MKGSSILLLFASVNISLIQRNDEFIGSAIFNFFDFLIPEKLKLRVFFGERSLRITDQLTESVCLHSYSYCLVKLKKYIQMNKAPLHMVAVNCSPDFKALLFYSKTFNPTAPAIMKLRNKRRFQLADSLKNKIPIRTAPAAPSPVHTA